MPLRLIRGNINLPKNISGCVATMGNFDGIHLGHRHLIERVTQSAREKKLHSVLITFEPQPNEFFSQKSVPARLMRLREKLSVLKTFNLDYVLCLRFNQALAALTAEEFIQRILLDQLNISHIVVGDDAHFGAHRKGDIALLKQIGAEKGFTAENIETYVICPSDLKELGRRQCDASPEHSFSYVRRTSHLDNIPRSSKAMGMRVSSSLVRSALTSGDLKMAERLLGRPFGMSGYVVHGHKRGRIIGFPTANIHLHRQTVPILGVYAVNVYGLTDGTVHGVANVGTRPTVDGTRSLLEVHLFDFSRDIYGEHLHVEFMHKLRDEKRYDSFDALKQQILKDAEEARQFFIGG
jgi:riboflavin kinase/FMN adenylyltransferase